MTQYTEGTRKKVVRQHIQDGRTWKSLATEYAYPQPQSLTGDALTTKNAKQTMKRSLNLNLLEEVRRLRQEKAELEKENDF